MSMSPMVGLWLPTAAGRDRLVVMRLVRLEEKEVCQGIVLDGENLGGLLAEEVQDLFPGARVLPARDPAAEQLPPDDDLAAAVPRDRPEAAAATIPAGRRSAPGCAWRGRPPWWRCWRSAWAAGRC